MDKRQLEDRVSVSGQITVAALDALKAAGVTQIICNRPDHEEPAQPEAGSIAEAARARGIDFAHIPVSGGQFGAEAVAEFRNVLATATGNVHAYCRSGQRSSVLWALARAGTMPGTDILARAAAAGYDLSPLAPRLEAPAPAPAPKDSTPEPAPAASFDVVVVGGGAAGIATAASLLRRRPGLKLAVIEPARDHYYQPGWTMVGGGIFPQAVTVRPMAAQIPRKATLIDGAVAEFAPDRHQVRLTDGRRIGYRVLIAAPGLKLDWGAIPGLTESLGRNGVTSNYRFDLAPYTWEQVQKLEAGEALFTQPPMPIKCAGAPQKALYLSADHWFKQGHIGKIKVSFHNAGAVLFGVKEYVPALMEYMTRYAASLHFESRLIAIDGDAKVASFAEKDAGGNAVTVRKPFDFIHVVPPQTAPDFVRASPLAGEGGWIDVDQKTMRHSKFENVFALGDAASAPNAKTAAAARKQAPVVAENALAVLDGRPLPAEYDGYGSCPLTVERGRIVLAEFGYGGKLLPSFPKWLIDGTRPSRLAWMLKADVLPAIYWNAMLKGREWLAAPHIVSPGAARAPEAATAR